MEPDPDTAQWYRNFARQARGHSPAYEHLATEIAADAELLALLAELPVASRQPNLLLAATQYHQGPVEDYTRFRAWALDNWSALRHTMLYRRTQTNEVGRCATLLPVLAALPQPLALIEVGASAGLCLYPDRYRYRYAGRGELGPADSPVVLDCAVDGAAPLPDRLPEVVLRAGIDLNPLDVTDTDDVQWLESLIWPGQPERVRLLHDAVSVARAEPPQLVRGDLNTSLQELLAQVPTGATPVVLHTAVLAYLSPQQRASFAESMREMAGYWISNESPSVFPEIRQRITVAEPTDRETFLLAVNGHPVAFTAPHGQSMTWFADAVPAAR